jgi:nitrogen fixation NifU-like protein
MTSDLHLLYEEMLLEHGRRPRNRRAIEGGHVGERHNPLCGDRIMAYVRVENDVIQDASFEGSACAIAIASASLMTEAVRHKAPEHAVAIGDRLRRLIAQPHGASNDASNVASNDGSNDGPFDDLGPLVALRGVRLFPIRIRCALLPWEALRLAVERSRRA